jgi:hypothetical protein
MYQRNAVKFWTLLRCGMYFSVLWDYCTLCTEHTVFFSIKCPFWTIILLILSLMLSWQVSHKINHSVLVLTFLEWWIHRIGMFSSHLSLISLHWHFKVCSYWVLLLVVEQILSSQGINFSSVLPKAWSLNSKHAYSQKTKNILILWPALLGNDYPNVLMRYPTV